MLFPCRACLGANKVVIFGKFHSVSRINLLGDSHGADPNWSEFFHEI